MAAAMRIAGVGAGYFSQFHLEAWKAIDGVDYVALCDTDRNKAEQLAVRFGIRQVFTDAGEMLDRVQPDLFDIVTGPATHWDLVQLACSRRLATICQKALAPSYEEASAIVESAESAGSLFVVHENFRWQPWYREAKRLLLDGMLGTPHTIAFRMRPGYGQGPRAYLDRQPYFQTMPAKTTTISTICATTFRSWLSFRMSFDT